MKQPEMFEAMRLSSETGRQLRAHMRTIPIISGVLSGAGLHLASFVSAQPGLHRVVYMVVDPVTVCGFGSGSTRALALASARDVVSKLGLVAVLSTLERLKEFNAEKDAADRDTRAATWEADTATRSTTAKVKSIPRRRRQIFDASGGQCHYCSTPLTLDGKWHIEHKMPKALMGGNEPSNLVASCTTCNHKKRDLTDVEFIATRESAA